MKIGKMIWVLLVVGTAATAAWTAAGGDLFGASPDEFASSADYTAPRDIPPDPPLSNRARVTPSPMAAPDMGKPALEHENAPLPETEQPADDAPRTEGATAAAPPADATGIWARFPYSEKPVGLDPFLRNALTDHVIQPGDALVRIAKRVKVPHVLLANINGIENGRIYAGATIQVVQGPFDVLVLRSRCLLRLYCRGVFVKEYGVTVGREGMETPLGEYRVSTKMETPQWTNPENGVVIPFGHPDNPLGTRWMGLRNGIGIHGTWEAESIGHAASHGCVRMRNADVEELFNLLVRRDSVVLIADDAANAPRTVDQADIVPGEDD